MPSSRLRLIALSAALAIGLCQAARAQSTVSDASALSMLPIGVSVVAPVAILSGGVALTVVSVEATASGAIWVLERASDGARASVRLAGRAAVGVGTAVLVTAVSTGWVLSSASQAIAFVPNEIGAALLYNERITR